MGDLTHVVVLVGCGAAAERLYARPLVDLQGAGRLSVLVVDADPGRGRAFGHRHGFSWCETLSDAKERGVVAALLATPHHVHHSGAMEAIGLGLNVFVEKPGTVDPEHAREIVAAAEARGLTAMVNNNRRLFPTFRDIAKRVRMGDLGRVKSITVTDGNRFAWPMQTPFYLTDPGAKGVLLDRGSHTIDIVCSWAEGSLEVSEAFHDGLGGGPDATFQLGLRGESTVPKISIRFSRLYDLENRYHIVGDAGEVRGHLFTWARYEYRSNGSDWTTVAFSDAPATQDAFVGLMLSEFVGALDGATPSFLLRDVIPSIDLISKAYSASRPFDLPWYSCITRTRATR